MTQWPLVPLGDVLKRSGERVTLNPAETYREVTVKLWGKGVTLRGQVSGSEIASADRFVVRPNQFIASRIDARNGAFGLIPQSLDGAVVTNDFPVFNIAAERLLPEFLGWMSKTAGFVDLCKRASEGTTNRVRLKEDSFLAMPVALPPLGEQRRIVARVDAVATRLAEARRLQDETDTQLTQLLRGRYREIVADAPRRPLNDVAPQVRRKVSIDLEGSYPELGIRSFGKGTFHKPPLLGSDVGSKQLYEIKPGDLVFNNVFAWEGAVAVARPNDSGRFGSHRFITCRPKDRVVTAEFMLFHFKTEDGLDQLRAASPGGAGRNRTLGLTALAKLPVPVPPLEQQLAFDALQAKADAVRGLQAETAGELDALLPSVLNKVVAGEL
jgi:type I restriction enzyme S subunit